MELIFLGEIGILVVAISFALVCVGIHYATKVVSWFKDNHGYSIHDFEKLNDQLKRTRCFKDVAEDRYKQLRYVIRKHLGVDGYGEIMQDFICHDYTKEIEQFEKEEENGKKRNA